MAYAAIACTDKSYRRNNIIILSIMSIVAIASVVMLIYSFVNDRIHFGLAWLIAFVLSSSYVLIRRNTVFSTYLATDKQSIYMNTWTNDFLPYDVSNKIKLVREFIPAKTKLIKIPIEEINSVVIGTKNFIKRYAEECIDFQQKVLPFEKTKDYYQKRAINSMDIFFVITEDGSSYFMPIEKFSSRDVSRVLQLIQRFNPDINIKINSKTFRLSLKK